VRLRKVRPADVAWKRERRAGRRWAIYGALLGLMLALPLFAPATWLADVLFRTSGEHLLLADAQGTVWTGHAVAVLQGGPDSRDAAALPGRVHWRIRLHWSGLRLKLRQACCLKDELVLELHPGLRGFTVTLPAHAEAIGQWPARWLDGLGTPWNTLQLGGTVQVTSPGFSLQSTQGQLHLRGVLDLQLFNASSRVSAIAPLGSYRFSVRSGPDAAQAATLTLETLEGPLQLSGTGQWTGARLRFRGQARAADGHEAGLANLLNIIGRRQGALSVISIG